MNEKERAEHYAVCELLVSNWLRGELFQALTVLEKVNSGWETENMRNAIVARMDTGASFFGDSE